MQAVTVGKSRDLTPIIQYVCRIQFSETPGELFDRYLWFYSELERLQHSWVYGRRSQGFACWKTGGDSPTSVGLSVRRKGRVELWHVGQDVDELIGMIAESQRVFRKQRHLVRLVDRDLATLAARRLGCEVDPGIVKLYTHNAPALKSPSVRLLSRSDERLLSQIRPRRWPGYQRFLDRGYRFYGLIRDGRLISMCGLTLLTGTTSQLMGVETYRDEDKRKGYAKCVCAEAVRNGLAMDTTVTWSTSTSNLASIQTATSLGFRPYYEECRLDIRSKL